MKKSVVILILCCTGILFSACSKEENNNGELSNLQNEIGKLEKEIEELRKKEGESGLVAEKPVSEYTDAFLQNFCSLVKEDVTLKDLQPYIRKDDPAERMLENLKKLAEGSENCKLVQKQFYDYPFEVAEYKTDYGYLYVQAYYSPNFKITRILPLGFKDKLELQLHNVKTRDGQELTTYVAHKANLSEKKGTIFLRTPYMVYGHYLAFVRLALELDKVMVIQSNRGSHNSTGDFRWLDKINIDDSYDSVDWIAGQPFSNGKVIGYGVSYDGYNALATAASQHPSLRGTVACSAPANAATDSFTSGKFVETGIFGYVTSDRDTSTLGVVPNVWEFVNTDVSSTARAKMDDILLGLDSDEWNLTSQAIDDQGHKYWQDRQLLDELSQTKTPIVHIAGLVNDQDGRDTLLAYNHLQKTSAHKDKHFLSLHKSGHGCGNALDLAVVKKIFALADVGDTSALNNEPHVSRYHAASDKFIFGEELEGLGTKVVSFPIEEKLEIWDWAFMVTKDPALFQKELSIPIVEDMNLNGAPKIKLHFTATGPEIPLHVHYVALDPEGKSLAYGWRTAVVSQKVDSEESVELIFPLVNITLGKGSTIAIRLSTRNPRVFDRQPEVRKEFAKKNLPAQIQLIEKLGESSQIEFPVELTSI